MSQIFPYRLLFFLASLTVIPTLSYAVDQDDKEHCRLSIRHIEGGGIGYSQGYTTLEGFFAPNPEGLPLMPFLDLRGHVFNNGKMAANGGLGLRGILGSRAYGLFNLSPLNVDAVNIGTINASGTITPVESCSAASCSLYRK